MNRRIYLIICLLSAFWLFSSPLLHAETRIIDWQSDKARYAPGETVHISLDLSADAAEKNPVEIRMDVFDLDRRIDTACITSRVPHAGTTHAALTWRTPTNDYHGYLLKFNVLVDGRSADEKTGAVDVSSDWARFPRFGYLCHFDDISPEKMASNLAWLSRYHLNGLQFYDWQDKHHRPLAGTPDAPAEQWQSVNNGCVLKKTIEGYLAEAHRRNIAAMSYGLINGAYDEPWADGVKREWSLFKKTDGSEPDYHPLEGHWETPRIVLLDPSNPGWRDYCFAGIADMFRVYPFDGWYADQVGYRGQVFNDQGQSVPLEKTYAPFLVAARKKLGCRLMMNGVIEYGETEIARCPAVDALYVEVWPNVTAERSYQDLQEIIERGRTASGQRRNMIIAGYMNYAKARHDPGTAFNAPGVLMADAVIAASGGNHLELGEGGRMLCHEFFPIQNLTLEAPLANQLRAGYDFAVAYQNWLRDVDVRPAFCKVQSGTVALSPDDRPGSAWYFVRRRGDFDVLHLINLIAQQDNDWRDDDGVHPEPVELHKVRLEYFPAGDVRRVLWASPDYRGGSVQELPFTNGVRRGESFISFQVPHLKYWDMVWIERATTQNKSFATGYSTISVAGTFNQWNLTADPMTLVDDYQWAFDTVLEDEPNIEFKFIANGQWKDNWGEKDQPGNSLPLTAMTERDGKNIRIQSAGRLTCRILFNERTGEYRVMPVYNHFWLGNVSGNLSAEPGQTSTCFRVNAESWPPGAAMDAQIVYSLDQGETWRKSSMCYAGRQGNNDGWQALMGPLPAKDQLRYFVQAKNPWGILRWDDNQGKDYNDGRKP